MNSVERHNNRYNRRKYMRDLKKKIRSSEVGTVEAVMSFHNLYKYGKKCCNGVRWKRSTQNFESHIFSTTAVAVKQIHAGKWHPCKPHHFTLHERGKIRPIDAPTIRDRQIEKVYTKEVLIPLYAPSMIYNNGASQDGKGYDFSKNMLKSDLREYFRKFGFNGHIILLDFKKFFPTAPHSTILERHNTFIHNKELREIGDIIVKANGDGEGMPLGVEPSQAEMIALPSYMDNYIQCQLGLKYSGHYMDDYYILVPPHIDANNILSEILNLTNKLKLTISSSKTKIQSIRKSFKYCKAKYTLTNTGKVIVRGNRNGLKRARKNIKSFKRKLDDGKMSYLSLWASVNGILAYFKKDNNHHRLLKLRRLFFAIYGFSPERYLYFKNREGINKDVHST